MYTVHNRAVSNNATKDLSILQVIDLVPRLQMVPASHCHSESQGQWWEIPWKMQGIPSVIPHGCNWEWMSISKMAQNIKTAEN